MNEVEWLTDQTGLALAARQLVELAWHGRNDVDVLDWVSVVLDKKRHECSRDALTIREQVSALLSALIESSHSTADPDVFDDHLDADDAAVALGAALLSAGIPTRFVYATRLEGGGAQSTVYLAVLDESGEWLRVDATRSGGVGAAKPEGFTESWVDACPEPLVQVAREVMTKQGSGP